VTLPLPQLSSFVRAVDPLCALHIFYDGPPPEVERRCAQSGSAAAFLAAAAQAEERSLESLALRTARSQAQRRGEPAAAALQVELKRFRAIALAHRALSGMKRPI